MNRVTKLPIEIIPGESFSIAWAAFKPLEYYDIRLILRNKRYAHEIAHISYTPMWNQKFINTTYINTTVILRKFGFHIPNSTIYLNKHVFELKVTYINKDMTEELVEHIKIGKISKLICKYM